MAREKTKKLVVTFSCTTDAMHMEKCSKENNIPGRIVPVPRSISSSCGLAWIVPERDAELVINALDSLGIPSEGQYYRDLI